MLAAIAAGLRPGSLLAALARAPESPWSIRARQEYPRPAPCRTFERDLPTVVFAHKEIRVATLRIMYRT